MIRDFLAWWGDQLLECVPQGWRRLASPTPDALVIAPAGHLGMPPDAASVYLRRNGRENPLGRYTLTTSGLLGMPHPAGLPAILRLAETDLLSKIVSLPAAAERNLAQVLAFEMDRETPFSAEEVFWTYRIVNRDHERGRISVQLSLIPRTHLNDLIEVLGRTGIALKCAEVSDDGGQSLSLPLGSDGGAEAAMRGNLLRWSAFVVCAGLAIAVVAIPFARQSSAIAALDEAIGQGRDTAAEAEKLRREIQRLSSSAELINTERDNAGRPLVVLAAVTQMLPSDTYLTEIQQQQRKVTLSGRSAGASRLIAALSASDRLHNPSFAAPVTRIEAIRAEVFTITAEVVP